MKKKMIVLSMALLTFVGIMSVSVSAYNNTRFSFRLDRGMGFYQSDAVAKTDPDPAVIHCNSDAGFSQGTDTVEFQIEKKYNSTIYYITTPTLKVTRSGSNTLNYLPEYRVSGWNAYLCAFFPASNYYSWVSMNGVWCP